MTITRDRFKRTTSGWQNMLSTVVSRKN